MTLFDLDEETAMMESTKAATELFEMIPTIDETSGVNDEIDFVTGYIAAKSFQFSEDNKLKDALGKTDKDYVYITVGALKDACKNKNFDYYKLVKDLVKAKFFIPDEETKEGRKNPDPTVCRSIGGIKTRVLRIPRGLIYGNDDSVGNKGTN